MIVLLYLSLALLILSGLTALVYELHATFTHQEPQITYIVANWLLNHNLIGSIIMGLIIGLLFGLAFHFFTDRIKS